MKAVLEKAGASFLRAFGGALIVLAPGILAAPNLTGALLLAAAALGAALTAGFRALQVFVPQLTFKGVLGEVKGAYADSFARAFLGSFLTLAPGIWVAPDLNTAKGAATAAIIGAVTAGIRAVQGLITKGEQPAPNAGV